MPFEFFPNTNFHDMNLDYILEKTQKIDDNMRDSQASADAAKLSEENAKASEENAKLSEENAKASEDAAKDYADHIADPVSGLVTDWLENNITQETGYVLDASLTSAAAAAPAKTVGDKAFIMRGNLTDDSDINSISQPGMYRKTSNVTPVNWPTDYISGNAYLLQFTPVYAVSPTAIQMITNGTMLLIRYNSTTTHNSWKEVAALDVNLTSENKAAPAKTVGDRAFLMRGDLTAGVDANDILVPGCYRKASTVTVENWPAALATVTSFMMCFVPVYAVSPSAIQIVSNGSRLFYRYNSTSTHGAWIEVDAGVEHYTAQPGELVSLLMSLASNTREKVIDLAPGVYNIFQEYKSNNVPSPDDDHDWGGSSYYEAYNVYIPVNTKLRGHGYTVLLWDPADTDISANEASVWSPVNIHGNVTIEGVTVICNNGRYCLHDDVHNAEVYRGMYHIFRDCDFIRETRSIPSTSWVQCTGTALTDRCNYLFERCTFSTLLSGPAWSCHDAPQTYTGRTQYDGALVDLVDCVFNAPNSSVGQMRLTAGSNSTFMRQRINVTGSYVQTVSVSKSDTSSTGSYQPYDITMLGCNSPTVNVTSGGRVNPIEYTPKIYN